MSLHSHTLHSHETLESAHQIFTDLQKITATGKTADLASILEFVAGIREVLVVFNHPCWDEERIGAERHAETAACLLRNYGRFIHALELNGPRPGQRTSGFYRWRLRMAKASYLVASP